MVAAIRRAYERVVSDLVLTLIAGSMGVAGKLAGVTKLLTEVGDMDLGERARRRDLCRLVDLVVGE
jgi:hypothetical protein